MLINKTTLRINLIFFSLLVLLGIIILRLIKIQIIEHQKHKEITNKQTIDTLFLNPMRGAILDRNGNVLAYSIKIYKLSADVDLIKDSLFPSIAQSISNVTGKPSELYLDKLQSCKNKMAVLETELSNSEFEKLSNLGIHGLVYEEKFRRIYPNGPLLAHVLGYVNSNSDGLDGIELEFEKILKGRRGFNLVQKDGYGKVKSILISKSDKVIDGKDVSITIDREIQKILEEELFAGAISANAVAGCGIIIDPSNGEILGLANYPTFDPSKYFSYDDFARRNRAVTDIYEPGSTFKSITMSAAIENNIVKPDEYIYAENGGYKFGKMTIKDDHALSTISISEALEYSSNIALAKIGLKLGKQELYRYTKNFGFGTHTNIELPGEALGDLRNLDRWNDSITVSVSYGYSIAVTPIQLITAYSAIVNGGKLLKPHLLKQIQSKDKTETQTFSKQEIRQVISEKTSATLREMLRKAVENGTGKRAKIDGIVCGGKTGTAKKLINKKYSDEFFFASFVGFYPVDNPKFLCLIILDSPKGNYYGGTVAAPIFKRIGERLFKVEKEIEQIQQVKLYSSNQTETYVPRLIGKSVQSAQKFIEALDLDLDNEGEGEWVVNQNSNVSSKQIKLVLGQKENSNNAITVPNVVGLSIRDAINELSLAKLKFRVIGSGYVIRQSIESGSIVNNGTVCELICSRN